MSDDNLHNELKDIKRNINDLRDNISYLRESNIKQKLRNKSDLYDNGIRK